MKSSPGAPDIMIMKRPAPFWTKVGERGPFGGEDSKVAFLDIHTPKALRSRENPTAGGTLKEARIVADKAMNAGFIGLQFNPISDSADEQCPYCSRSDFSYDPAVVDLESIPELQANGGLDHLRRGQQVLGQDQPTDTFNHRALREFNMRALWIGFAALRNDLRFAERSKEFRAWCAECDNNVLNYAVFTALHEGFRRPWWQWPERYRRRGVTGRSLLEEREGVDFHDEMYFVLYTQWIMEGQWKEFADHVEGRGGSLFLDKPFASQHNSADVWANQDLFYLDDEGQLTHCAGCNHPNDPYGEQNWKTAVLRMNDGDEQITKRVIDFYAAAIGHMAKVSKVIRLDHALGLVWSYWLAANKDRDTNAESKRVQALGSRLFQRLRFEFPDVYFIAEDGGYVSKEEVDDPLTQNGIPGMRCPTWSNLDANGNLVPRDTEFHEFPFFSVALTDNHDTAKLQEWWKAQTQDHKRHYLWQIYGSDWPKYEHLPMQPLHVLRAVWDTRSHIGVTTLQTVVDDDTRYNVPGVSAGSFNHRIETPVQDIDFRPVGRILEQTGRSINQLIFSNDPILASQPRMGEHQAVHAGDEATICIATKTMPQKIIVHTNAPIDGYPNPEGGWRVIELDPGDSMLWFQQYRDRIVCNVDVPIADDASVGQYHIAVNLRFSDDEKEHAICLKDNNIVLDVQPPRAA